MERYHIYPWEVILVIALVAVVLYVRRQQALRSGAAPARKGGKETPEEAYMRLRYQALTTIAARLGLPGELKPNDPYGALMEMGIPKSVVTLAAFADGDARLYYKTGGGMVGGISHESVRRAAQEFVGHSRKVLGRMTKVTEYPVPGPDRVRFYVLTPRGVFTTETDRQRLGETASDLSTLFRSGQEVVTQMRQVQETREAARPLMVPRPPVFEDEEPAAEPAPPAEPV
ncbi:MAG: hypothetical protein ACJ76Y_04830 [Thermoanaerobaculia bacterium]